MRFSHCRNSNSNRHAHTTGAHTLFRNTHTFLKHARAAVVNACVHALLLCRYAYLGARACPVVNARLFSSVHAFLKREKLSVGVEGERWVEGLRGVKREREGGKGRDREGEKGGWGKSERCRGREIE